MVLVILILFSAQVWSENLRWFDPSQGLQDCVIYNQENCSQFEVEPVPVRKLLGPKRNYFGMNFQYLQDYSLEQGNYRLHQMSVSNDITFVGETFDGSFFGLDVRSWGSPIVFDNVQAGEILEQNTVESAHLIFAQDILNFWEVPYYLTLETRVPVVNSRGIWQSWVRFDIPQLLKLDLGYQTQTHRMEMAEGGFLQEAQYFLRAKERSLLSQMEVRWNSNFKTSGGFRDRKIWNPGGRNSLGVQGEQLEWRVQQEVVWGRLKNQSKYEWVKWDQEGSYYKSFIQHQSTFAWTQSIYTLMGASYGTLYGHTSGFNNTVGWWGNASLYEDLIWMNSLSAEWWDVKFEPIFKYGNSKYSAGFTRRTFLSQDRQKWFLNIGSSQKNPLGSLGIRVQIPLSDARLNQNEGLKNYESGYVISLETTSQF